MGECNEDGNKYQNESEEMADLMQKLSNAIKLQDIPAFLPVENKSLKRMNPSTEKGHNTIGKPTNTKTSYKNWNKKIAKDNQQNRSDAPKMNLKDWENVMRRFETENEKISSRIHQQQQLKVEKELACLQNSPTLCQKSVELAVGKSGIIDRTARDLKNKEIQAEKARLQKEVWELHDVQKAPNLAAPCICNPNHGKRNKHTDPCLRFQKICKSINKNYDIHKRTNNMRRSIDDMLAYGEAKRIKNIQRCQYALDMEQKNATFSPSINKKSLEIYEGLCKTGKFYRKTPIIKDQKESFRPTICKRSRKLSSHLSKDNVFTRLNTHADKVAMEKIEKESRAMGEGIRNVPGLVKVDHSLKFHPVKESSFTVVKRTPECDFIIEAFKEIETF